ncbi:MAG: hypothetical protein RQ748_03140 [Elusimicrobiales bacterium]|nr:hypothetical protein [Elusimicrobiales bacterium]
MKTDKTGLLLAGIFMFAAAVPALAQEQEMEKAAEKKQEMTQAQEEESAAEAAGEINAAARGKGGKKVRARMMTQFGVDEGRIRTMREEGGMSHGEIAIVLSLAKGMDGGINDENIARISEMRKGKKKAGWGKIARDLGQKLGPAISQTRKMSAEMREERRSGTAGKKAKTKKAEGTKKNKKMRREREMKEHREHMRPMGGGGGGGKGRR